MFGLGMLGGGGGVSGQYSSSATTGDFKGGNTNYGGVGGFGAFSVGANSSASGGGGGGGGSSSGSSRLMWIGVAIGALSLVLGVFALARK